MRVLHVSTWDVPCGIATYCANLVRALDGHGIRSDVYPLAPHRWKTFTAGDVAELLADVASATAADPWYLASCTSSTSTGSTVTR